MMAILLEVEGWEKLLMNPLKIIIKRSIIYLCTWFTIKCYDNFSSNRRLYIVLKDLIVFIILLY